MIEFHRRYLIGMVHLLPLPGRPGSRGGDFDAVLERAVADGRVLQQAGFDAVMIQNYGDRPYASSVDLSIVAYVTSICREMRRVVDLPIGVCLLRNDGPAAVAVCAAAGGDFIRLKCGVGTMVWPEGFVQGVAGETIETMDHLGLRMTLMEDIVAPHAVNLYGDDVMSLAKAHTDFGQADALILTGSTLEEALELAVKAGQAVDGVPLFLGGGAREENISRALAVFDGAIVGRGIKQDGSAGSPVALDLAVALVRAARSI